MNATSNPKKEMLPAITSPAIIKKFPIFMDFDRTSVKKDPISKPVKKREVPEFYTEPIYKAKDHDCF